MKGFSEKKKNSYGGGGGNVVYQLGMEGKVDGGKKKM